MREREEAVPAPAPAPSAAPPAGAPAVLALQAQIGNRGVGTVLARQTRRTAPRRTAPPAFRRGPAPRRPRGVAAPVIVSVDLVRVAGGRSPDADMALAQQAWGACRPVPIQFEFRVYEVTPEQAAAWVRADGVVECGTVVHRPEDPDGVDTILPGHGHELMHAAARAALNLQGSIQVYYVQGMTCDATSGGLSHIPGHCSTAEQGMCLVAAANAHTRTLAHELGHMLGNNMHTFDDPQSLMMPSGAGGGVGVVIPQPVYETALRFARMPGAGQH